MKTYWPIEGGRRREWADKQPVRTLATKSPQTIKVALRQLVEEGRFAPILPTIWRMNMRWPAAVSSAARFRRGRARGHRRQGQCAALEPATPEAVSDAMIDSDVRTHCRLRKHGRRCRNAAR
jgi:enoyl-CoA hydratase